jgi:hypothetical protein
VLCSAGVAAAADDARPPAGLVDAAVEIFQHGTLRRAPGLVENISFSPRRFCGGICGKSFWVG